jgi:hypothetical protein
MGEIMASSQGGRLARGTLYGALIGAVVGVVLYFIIRGVAGQAFGQELPPSAADIARQMAIFGAMGAFMGFLSQVGSKPRKSDGQVDPETDRKLREQAAKERAKS